MFDIVRIRPGNRQQDDSLVEGFDNALYINCIRARQRGLDIFRRSFNDFSIEYEEMAPGFFRARIRTRQTLRKLLCFTGILALINAIQNRELKIVDDKLLVKYAKFIQYLDAPYAAVIDRLLAEMTAEWERRGDSAV